MDDVEAADLILDAIEIMNKRPAHVVDFVDEIGRQLERAAVIMHSVDALVIRLVMAFARKNMNLMLAARQSGSQFRDMDAHAAHGDGMQGFPRKQGYAHGLLLVD